jgi:hypothetical protein
VEEDSMKPFKRCIFLVLIFILQLHISHSTSHGETTLFDKGHATNKSFPLSMVRNDAAIILTIHFPESSHLIKDAGSSYTLALSKKILIKGTILSDETKITIPKLPDPDSTLILNLNYYYCAKEGVCHFQLSRWSIPVKLHQDGLRRISLTEIPDVVDNERSTTPLSF